MPYKAALKEVFAAGGITRVAIVDDAFDQIDLSEVNRQAITQVQTDLRELDEDRANREALATEIETLANVGLEELASTLREGDRLEALWDVYAGLDAASPVADVFRPLFAHIGANILDKLRPLRALKVLLLGIDNVAVDEFGSDTDAAMLAEHQLIFLDYYLNAGVPEAGTASSRAAEKVGRERSIEFLAKLVRERPDNLPLVMLISSRAKNSDLPDFRRQAQMLASKMNFLPKDYALSDPPRAQHSIMGLVKHTKPADALASLLKTWSDAVATASESMMISIRELDLTDYSYIQQYRLAGEKTPLGQYIAWLFNGRLTDLVETELRDKHVDKTVSNFTLPEAIPGRTSPTKAITELFSAVTTTRIPIGYDTFMPAAWSGDIFLETSVYNRTHGTRKPTKRSNKAYPDVLTVVTPACDLVPERAIDNPLRTITMIGGTLVPLAEAENASSHLLMLKGKPFVVDWNTKWPVTFPVGSVSPMGGPHDRYQWVGRYRDIYHAELQHRLLQDLGRPALPLPPTMPHWVPVKVLARTVKRPAQYEVVFEHAAEAQVAWTWLGKKSDKMFSLREEIVWEIRSWIQARYQTLGNTERQELQAVVDAPSFVDDLQLPMTLRKETGDLTCGAGISKTADVGLVSSGTKPLVIVFGTGVVPVVLAAA
jgi:hypothetical protein